MNIICNFSHTDKKETQTIYSIKLLKHNMAPHCHPSEINAVYRVARMMSAMKYNWMHRIIGICYTKYALCII